MEVRIPPKRLPALPPHTEFRGNSTGRIAMAFAFARTAAVYEWRTRLWQALAVAAITLGLCFLDLPWSRW